MPALHETDLHAQLREHARKFAAEEIAPHARAWEAAGIFPRELYARMGAQGMLGLGYDEAVGGAGGDLSHILAGQEELILHGKCVGAVVGVGTHRIALPPIIRHGTPAQIDRFVRPTLRGETIAALAITEPDGGSDVASLRTRARREGEHFIVDGAK